MKVKSQEARRTCVRAVPRIAMHSQHPQPYQGRGDADDGRVVYYLPTPYPVPREERRQLAFDIFSKDHPPPIDPRWKWVARPTRYKRRARNH